MDQAAIRVDGATAKMVGDKVGDGAEVLVGIRPEDVQVFNSKRSESDLEIVVESFEPLGSSIVISSLVDDKIFRLVLPPEQAVAPGNHLWLEWDSKKMHIFDKGGALLL